MRTDGFNIKRAEEIGASALAFPGAAPPTARRDTKRDATFYFLFPLFRILGSANSHGPI
jgi:hypothetical protein